jgi:hypothetical protein
MTGCYVTIIQILSTCLVFFCFVLLLQTPVIYLDVQYTFKREKLGEMHKFQKNG